MNRFFALTVGLACGVAGINSVSAAETTSNRVLYLTGHQTSAAEVAAPAGFVGTRFIGTEDVYDSGRLVGRAARSCEVVSHSGDGRATFQCVWTVTLPEGIVVLQAMPNLTEVGLEDARAAVTGGSGEYRHARGDAAIEELGPTVTGYAIDLR